MDLRKFNKSIQSSIRLADELGLNPQTINPASLSNNSTLRQLVDQGSSFLNYYQRTIDLRHLNFFIGDGDLFQFSFVEKGRSFSLRYAFFGSPYRHGSERIAIGHEMPSEGKKQQDEALLEGVRILRDVVDFEETDLGYISGDEVTREGGQSEIDGAGLSLRYEYAEQEYRRLVHPCAHLHLGWNTDGRIPVRRIWSPELFTFFIIRNLFARCWFEPKDGHVTDMDGYTSEILFKREKGDAQRVHDSMFHDFEHHVSFLD